MPPRITATTTTSAATTATKVTTTALSTLLFSTAAATITVPLLQVDLVLLLLAFQWYRIGPQTVNGLIHKNKMFPFWETPRMLQ